TLREAFTSVRQTKKKGNVMTTNDTYLAVFLSSKTNPKRKAWDALPEGCAATLCEWQPRPFLLCPLINYSTAEASLSRQPGKSLSASFVKLTNARANSR